MLLLKKGVIMRGFFTLINQIFGTRLNGGVA
jgi:hypothetical protein